MTKKDDHTAASLHDSLETVQDLLGMVTAQVPERNAALAQLNEALFRQAGTTRVAWVVLTRHGVSAGDRGKVGDVIGIALFTADRKVAENPACLWTTTARAAFMFIFEQRGFDVVPHRDTFSDRVPEQRKRVPLTVFEDGWGVKFTTVLEEIR